MKNNLNLSSIIFALVCLFVVVRSECNTTREVICQENEWKCADKRQCIPSNYFCDKYDDCIDKSDEQNCEVSTAKTTKKFTPKSTTKVVTDKTTRKTTPKSTTRIFTTTQKPITGVPGIRKCGQPAIKPITSNSRVIGGIRSRPHSWPWYAYLHDVQDPLFPGCGGSIINETTVITAAHCVKFNETWLKDGRVAAGSHDLDSGTDGPYQRRSVVKIFLPDIREVPHDIAILILNKPLVFNDNVSAICLPKAPVTLEQNCYAMGYGFTNDQLSNRFLNQARTPIVNWTLCRDEAWGALTPFDVCAGYLGGPADTCPGDSGGPLNCQMKDSRWYLNGITSRGGDCEDPKYPGVYTNVYKYIDWIAAKTGFKFE